MVNVLITKIKAKFKPAPSKNLRFQTGEDSGLIPDFFTGTNNQNYDFCIKNNLIAGF